MYEPLRPRGVPRISGVPAEPRPSLAPDTGNALQPQQRANPIRDAADRAEPASISHVAPGDSARRKPAFDIPQANADLNPPASPPAPDQLKTPASVAPATRRIVAPPTDADDATAPDTIPNEPATAKPSDTLLAKIVESPPDVKKAMLESVKRGNLSESQAALGGASLLQVAETVIQDQNVNKPTSASRALAALYVGYATKTLVEDPSIAERFGLSSTDIAQAVGESPPYPLPNQLTANILGISRSLVVKLLHPAISAIEQAAATGLPENEIPQIEREARNAPTTFLVIPGERTRHNITYMEPDQVRNLATRLHEKTADRFSPEDKASSYLNALIKGVQGRVNGAMLTRVMDGLTSEDPQVVDATKRAIIVLNGKSIRAAVNHIMDKYELPEDQRHELTKAGINAVYDRAPRIAAKAVCDAKNTVSMHLYHEIRIAIHPRQQRERVEKEIAKPNIITYMPRDTTTVSDTTRKLLADVVGTVTGSQADQQRVLHNDNIPPAAIRSLVNAYNTYAQSEPPMYESEVASINQIGKLFEAILAGKSRREISDILQGRRYDYYHVKLVNFLTRALKTSQYEEPCHIPH